MTKAELERELAECRKRIRELEQEAGFAPQYAPGEAEAHYRLEAERRGL